MYIDKKVRGVSFYYKVKAFGLICRYVLIALGILFILFAGIMQIFAL